MTGRSVTQEQTDAPPRFAAGLRRRWRWIVTPTLLAALGAVVFVLYATPRYTGVAMVLLDDRDGALVETDSAAEAGPQDLAPKAIERLGRADRQELDPSGAPGAQPSAHEVEAFLRALAVSGVPRSRVLRIAFEADDPKSAANGANAFAEVLVQSRNGAKPQAKLAGAWLSPKIDALRAKVAAADASREAFRAQSDLLAGASGAAAPALQTPDLNAELAAARAAEAAAQAKADGLRQLQAQGRLDEAPPAIADESLRRLNDQRAQLKAQIAEASRTLLPLHPRMKELAAELAVLDAQIQNAAAHNLRALDNEAKLAADQAASLSAALSAPAAPALNTTSTDHPDDGRLRVLEAEDKAAHDQLDSYLQTYREAVARDAGSAPPAGARIVASAAPPDVATYPHAWRTVLLSTLAAFLASCVFAAAATRFAGERASRLIPASPAARRPTAAVSPEPIPERPPHEAAEELAAPLETEDTRLPEAIGGADELGARLLARKPPQRSLTALIVGGGWGRALPLALETARRLSQRGPTVLVDLGATQDWFVDILDREDSEAVELPGLADLMAGRASYAGILRRDLSSRLDVAPSGGEVGAEGLADVLAALASAYDHVVLHASDWRLPAALAAAQAADAVVVAAPAARIARVTEGARAALGDACPEILPFAERRRETAMAEAA